MEEKPAESFRVSKTEKALTEGRVALISILIAVPAAFLIAMLIHFFVAIPEQSFFSAETVIETPARYVPPAANAKKPAHVKPAPKRDLMSLYVRKVELCKADMKAAKTGLEIKNAETAYLLAEGELFRYENGIRRWGNSVTDLAIRAEAARYIAAKIQRTNAAEIKAIELEIQLKSHRTFSNEDWQNAYAAYQKAPGVKTYRAMLEAEQAARPPRRF